MNTPKWLFFVLVFWLAATIWCNALEPAATTLIPSSVATTIEGEESLQDPSLTTAVGLTRVWGWVTNIGRALIFDYAIFEGWLNILRVVCIIFSIGSLLYLADIIWKIRSMLFGG